jgi:hypothetical protein
VDEETAMLKKIILMTIVIATATLLTPSKVDAWGAARVGYTRVGPAGGVYHGSRTVAAGPRGVYAGGHGGAVGAYGGAYHYGYGAAAGYGGYRYGYAGGYRYGYVR